nr:thioesterase family protein [uncultured Flavobacterium sp.]
MDNVITQFKFSLPLQLRWNDQDALGHVNNAVYLSYFETARGHFMPTACPGWDWYKNMFLIANISISFQKELVLLAKNPKVHIRTTKIGTKSFDLEYLITSEIKGETVIHATGTSTQVMFDVPTRKTIEISDTIRTALSNFDNL